MLRLRRALPLLLVAAALPSSVLAAPPAVAGEGLARRVDALREEARALVLVQAVLSWYTRTVGEPSIQADTYRGHEALFSREAIADVGRARDAEKDPTKQRALSFLRSYLAGEYLGQHLARFDDEAQNLELSTTVNLPWEKQPVPYKQLDILTANEKDASRRAAIESARAKVWRGVLNPVLEKKEAEAQRLARELGYRSYVDLATEYRMVDLKALIAEAERFRVATEATYVTLLAIVVQRELGLPIERMKRSDLPRLFKAPRLERFFPKELMEPAFAHFLAGIGLDLSTVNHKTIRIDDALHPQKEPRAACYNVRVPDDVRITVKPTGGIDDFVTFFHEGGHALHYANTKSNVWEFQQLGPYALTEGYAETFGHVWDDPAWLRRYRDFVGQWNATHKTAYPTMSDQDITDLVQLRVFHELYFLRRYGSAKLIYEAALHGGDSSLWRAVWSGPTENLAALYQKLFGRAYGFPLTEEDALRYRTDVDDLFYAADYERAFGLANLVQEALRKKYGPDWYTAKDVGRLFRDQLFTDGDRMQPDDVAKLLGAGRFDLRASEARIARLLGR